uniref:Response regulatory domain-containing protein n=1 Tax=Ananas comosus var. bracteatus TaxID=296719 RepID=A0A6V7QC15_ANACO|nr:unnamed protein product [Ananas comosus var. bracteatus]
MRTKCSNHVICTIHKNRDKRKNHDGIRPEKIKSSTSASSGKNTLRALVVDDSHEDAAIDGVDAKIVGITANASSESKAEFMEAGIDDFLLKPLTADNIASLLENMGKN